VILRISYLVILVVGFILFFGANSAFAIIDEDGNFTCSNNKDLELAYHQELFLKIQEEVNKIDDTQFAKKFLDKKIENDKDGILYIKSKSCLQSLGEFTPQIQFKEEQKSQFGSSFIETILAVLAATSITGIITYVIAIKQIKKTLEANTEEAVKRNTRSLIIEVRGINVTFENQEPHTITIDGNDIRYYRSIFSTSTFDGLIASGEFSHFDEPMHTSIEQFYFRIHMHNKISYQIRDAKVTANIHSIRWDDKMILADYRTITNIDTLLEDMAEELLQRLGD